MSRIPSFNSTSMCRIHNCCTVMMIDQYWSHIIHIMKYKAFGSPGASGISLKVVSKGAPASSVEEMACSPPFFPSHGTGTRQNWCKQSHQEIWRPISPISHFSPGCLGHGFQHADVFRCHSTGNGSHTFPRRFQTLPRSQHASAWILLDSNYIQYVRLITYHGVHV